MGNANTPPWVIDIVDEQNFEAQKKYEKKKKVIRATRNENTVFALVMEKSAYKLFKIEVDEETSFVKVHDLLMFIGKYKKRRGAEIMFNRLPPPLKSCMVPMKSTTRRGKRAFFANNDTVCHRSTCCTENQARLHVETSNVDFIQMHE